jgi:hypothetical protein
MKKPLFSAVAAIVLLNTPAHGFDRFLDFSSASDGIGASDFYLIADPGFSATQSNERLLLTKGAVDTPQASQILFKSKFLMTGQFEVTVDPVWQSGNAMDAGLRIRTESGYVSIYYVNQSTYWVSNGNISDGYSGTLPQFRAARGGDGNLAVFRRSGNGWNSILSINASGPASVELFLSQEQQNGASALASFDNLTIRADGIADHATNGLRIAKAVQICFPTDPGRYYFVDWASTTVSNQWFPLNIGILGTGPTNCIVDPIADFTMRIYRIRASN